ncbi:MAG: hypothetical protein V4703_12900 [Actinomycetota bacterium]
MTDVTGDDLTVSATAIEGYTAADHAAGTEVVGVWTRGGIEKSLDRNFGPEDHNLTLWSMAPDRLGASANHAPANGRESGVLAKLLEPLDDDLNYVMWWHHRQQNAPTGSANLYLTVREPLTGVLIAKTANLVPTLPTGVGGRSAALVLESGKAWSELPAGPGKKVKLGVYIGTIGNFLLGKNEHSDSATSVNMALVTGTHVLRADVQSAADAAGPTATINPLTQVGPDNNLIFLAIGPA